MRRVPYLGASNSRMGAEAIESVLGPLSRSLSGIVTFMKAVADGQPWNYDPAVVELPWKSEELTLQSLGGGKKLAFGVIRWDGVILPHPPVLRAIKTVSEALRKAGHESRLQLCFSQGRRGRL
jgi:amidase